MLPYLTFALPLAVWLLVSYFRQLPTELEDAALVDGASRLRALWEVVLPLAALNCFIVGLVIGFPALRVQHHYLAFATLAMQLILLSVLAQSEWAGGAIGLQGIPRLSVGGFELDEDIQYAYLVWIGLAIVAQLARMMHGHVWAESDVGRGSTFHLDIQLGLQDEGAARVTRVDPGALRGVRALVVDDNATNRRILVDTLRGWGMRAAAAESGELGLAMLNQAGSAGDPFRVVLLDCHMPGMDGFGVAERIAHDGRVLTPLDEATVAAVSLRVGTEVG